MPRQSSLMLAAVAARSRAFLADESGQDMIEYVLAAALISLVAITALKGLGGSISSAYATLSSNLTSST
jgi:Flp pilus assembly pilin Flp